jgi:HEAT repeat protein
MRPLVWIGLAAVAAVLAALWLAPQRADPEISPATNAASATIQAPTPRRQSTVASAQNPATNPTAPAPDPVVVSSKTSNFVARAQAEAKEALIERLHDYGTESQPRFLDLIAKELENSDPEIRHAAVEALIQFGNRDAIPILRQRADLVEDPKEKAELQEAADYLALPTLGELQGVSPHY